MPLTAIIRGQRITGPDLSSEEWKELKKEHKKGLPIIMSCCGSSGHLRTSRRGLQHFYHAPGYGPCNWERESLAHLEIKYEIYKICKNAGWESYVEYSSIHGDWKADVYTKKDDKEIVFEVQLSKISNDILKERDKKYKENGIEAYWLLENRGKYQLNDFGGFGEDLNDIPYVDYYFSSDPEYENPNKAIYYAPKDVLAVEIFPETQLVSTGNRIISPLVDWVHSILDGSYYSNIEKIRKEFVYYQELRIIASPVLKEVNTSHRKIIKSIHDLKRQYAIFKNYPVDDPYQIKDNIRLLYNTKKEMTSFFFGRVLSPKLGWIWIKNDHSSHIEHLLHLKTYEQVYEIERMSLEATKIIDTYERLLIGLTQQIQQKIKTESKPEIKEKIPENKISPSGKSKQSKTQDLPNHPISNPHQDKSIPRPKWKLQYLASKKGRAGLEGSESFETMVRFEAKCELIDNWLLSSNGIKYQVIPGLPVDMDESVAIEFEKLGYGRIVGRKHSSIEQNPDCSK